ncbi:unnamed protein product [Caenorhabditis angaria]|uniref:Serpentine receptor class gamma n=1 Tax=Caenorhabditis angaria TaxID=860376 RepID=A0A9P1I9M7_9PELO|nr:unnamed protein product [Caenorhabditis angaria]
MALMSTRNAEEKVFSQLLATVILYGSVSIFYEAVVMLDGVIDERQVITLISLLNIINYFPEMSLPLMLMISALKSSKNVSSTTVSTLNR